MAGLRRRAQGAAGGRLLSPARARSSAGPSIYTRGIHGDESALGTSSVLGQRHSAQSGDGNGAVFEEQSLQPTQEILGQAQPQLTLLPGSAKQGCSSTLSTAPRQRHMFPHPKLRDRPHGLGSNSRSPAPGPFHSPMLSLGTKCKSVAVPASIKNFKNRTKQTEKDFHNHLKIHQSPKRQQTPDNLFVPHLRRSLPRDSSDRIAIL